MSYCVICDHEFYGDDGQSPAQQYVCISCLEHICECCLNLCENCDGWICDNCDESNHGNCEFQKCYGCDFKHINYDFAECSNENCNKIFCTNSYGGNECDISNKNLIRCFKCGNMSCDEHRFDLKCNMCDELETCICICYNCIDDNMNIDEIIKSNTEKCENDCWKIKNYDDFYYININTIYCSDHYASYYNDKMKKIIEEINDSHFKCDVVADIISEFILMW